MATVNMTDAKMLVRLKLIGTTALTDLVEERVYAEFPVDPNDRTMKYPLVVFDFFSGQRHISSAYQQANFHVYCFSRNSSDEAARLYDLCSNTLHMQLLKHDGVPYAGYAQETARPNENWDVNARAHIMWGRFALRTGGSSS